MTLHTVGTRWGQHYGTMENAFASAWTDLCSKGTEKSYIQCLASQCQQQSCNVIINIITVTLMTPTILTHFVPGYTWPLAGGPRSATYGIGAQRGISLLLQSIGLHKARIVGLCA